MPPTVRFLSQVTGEQAGWLRRNLLLQLLPLVEAVKVVAEVVAVDVVEEAEVVKDVDEVVVWQAQVEGAQDRIVEPEVVVVLVVALAEVAVVVEVAILVEVAGDVATWSATSADRPVTLLECATQELELAHHRQAKVSSAATPATILAT